MGDLCIENKSVKVVLPLIEYTLKLMLNYVFDFKGFAKYKAIIAILTI